jgi:hypothetical protein
MTPIRMVAPTEWSDDGNSYSGLTGRRSETGWIQKAWVLAPPCPGWR